MKRALIRNNTRPAFLTWQQNTKVDTDISTSYTKIKKKKGQSIPLLNTTKHKAKLVNQQRANDNNIFSTNDRHCLLALANTSPRVSAIMLLFVLTSAGLFVPFTSAFTSPPAFSLFSVTLSTATSELFSLELIFTVEFSCEQLVTHFQLALFKNEDGAGLELDKPVIGWWRKELLQASIW